MIFDDKMGQNHELGYVVKEILTEYSDILFTSSYIVVSDLKCIGKINANFNLIVVGDVSAESIYVKGDFICLGKCKVTGSLETGGLIWVNEVFAKGIISHDSIMAVEIDANEIRAESQITASKTLGVEKLLETINGVVLCGETIYGSGAVRAKVLLTAETPDLDGEIQVETSPYSILDNGVGVPSEQVEQVSTQKGSLLMDIFALSRENNFLGIIERLKHQESCSLKIKISKQIDTLQKGQDELILKKSNLITYLRLFDICNDEVFSCSSDVEKLFKQYSIAMHNLETDDKRDINIDDVKAGTSLIHQTYGQGQVLEKDNRGIISVIFADGDTRKFKLPDAASKFEMLVNERAEDIRKIFDDIEIDIKSYQEFIEILDLLNRYGARLNKELFEFAYEMVYSKIGVKLHYLDREFSERGWVRYAK